MSKYGLYIFQGLKYNISSIFGHFCFNLVSTLYYTMLSSEVNRLK